MATDYKILKVRLAALERLVKERFKSRDRGVKTALKALNKRLDGMNEIRQSLKDAQETFITATEARGEFKSIDKELSSLRESRSEAGGQRDQRTSDRGDSQWSIGTLVAVGAIILTTVLSLAAIAISLAVLLKK